MTPRSKYRLGVLATHPIQYYSPWFRHLSEHVDLEVFYAHRQDRQGQAAAGFGVEFDWDIPLLDGYSHRFLRNVSRRPALSHFSGLDTPEVADIIHQGRFDAFLCIGWNRKCHWQAIRACWRQDTPILMRGDSRLSAGTPAIKRLVKYWPYRWFLPRIDAHLYVGQANRSYLTHYGVREEQLFFCPHFVDNDYFSLRAMTAIDAGQTDTLRDELDLPEDSLIALFVGKLIDIKQPLKFIEAVSQASQIDHRIHGVIVGAGPLEAICREQAASCQHIRFAGFQNQSRLPAYYALADFLVLPSLKETWGLVVNEAMACGTPCLVSTECGCAPDLIQDGVTGFLFNGQDVASLASLLLRASNLSDIQKQTLRRGVEDKIQQYSMTAATSGLLSALDAVCSRVGDRQPCPLV